MGVDRNEKIWAWSNTGSKIHAFVSPVGDGKLRAMCRKNTTRNADAVFNGKDDTSYPTYLCTRCMKLAEAMWDRAEVSMMPRTEGGELVYVAPATEAHDLGYVAPVDEREDAEGAAIDALHAEAIEMNAEETAKAELFGRTFQPTPQNAHRRQDDRVTPTRVWTNLNGEACVSYDILGPDWRGRQVTSHSALKVPLFRQLYREI